MTVFRVAAAEQKSAQEVLEMVGMHRLRKPGGTWTLKEDLDALWVPKDTHTHRQLHDHLTGHGFHYTKKFTPFHDKDATMHVYKRPYGAYHDDESVTLTTKNKRVTHTEYHPGAKDRT